MSTQDNIETFRQGLRGYITGFIVCAVITLISFATVIFLDVSSTIKIVAITLLAAIQVALQTYYFLHIGQRSTPKWNMPAYLFMIMSVSLIVLGSLWVMSNLNYNMMHHNTSEDEKFIIKDEGIKSQEHSH